MNKFLRYGLIASLVFLILAIVLTLLEDALTRKQFIDELFSVESASRFWLTGRFELAGLGPHLPISDGSRIGQWYQYTNGPFTPGQSIGILANWFSGLLWNFSGNLFAARIGSLFNSALMFYVISRALRPTLKDSTALERVVTVLWIWMMTLLSVTYSIDGINHSLGEFSGALWIALGLLVGVRVDRPREHYNVYLGSFLLGMAVFHSKFIYFPYGLLGVFALSVHKRSLKIFLISFLSFLAPQLIFLLWVSAFAGIGAALDWAQGRIAFIKYGNSGFDSRPKISGLINRLTHPDLEWVHFDFKVRLRIVLLTCAVPIITMIASVFKRRSKYVPLAVCISTVVLLFSIWFFFWHPSMWLRHFQPAVYGGWILCLGWFFYFINQQPTTRRVAIICVLSFVLSFWQLRKPQTLSAFHLLSRISDSYAYRCRRLNSDPSNLWRNPSCTDKH